MLISKSKSTLLKSIAMIVTVIMVVCVCLTACADQDARNAAQEAKEIAEKAQSSLDTSLKDYVKKDEVAKMIEDALNEFAAGDGKTMVINVLKSEAGSQVISDAVSAALGNQLAGLQNEEQVKALINAALSGDNANLSEAIKDAMSDYVTAETAAQLVSDALGGYFETIKPAIGDEIDAALEAYKTTVSQLIKDNIGDEIATYLGSEEAQALIEECIAKYQADGLQNAVEATAKIVALRNQVLNNHWTSADLASINAVYDEKIAPMFEGAEGESDLVQQMYLLLTCDRLALNANVAAFEDAINACESMEQAAAKIDEKIEELGRDINGDISSVFVNGVASDDPAMPGKFGYVIVVTPDGIQYYTTGNLAKLGKDNGDATVYQGFNLIVANYGDDTANYFSYVVNSDGVWASIDVDAVIVPVLSDADAVAEIAADMQALVDKFGEDYPEIRSTVPAIPDDVRTAEDESVPEHYVYNPAYGVIANAEFFVDYEDMIATIEASAKNVLNAIAAFNTRVGDGTIPADAKSWVEYQAAVDAYNLYEACRFDNVIDGVEEAYNAFLRNVNDGVAAAEEAARQEQLQAWADAYAEELANLDRLYFAAAHEKLPEIIHYAAVFDSPIYGVAFTTEESVELMEWANNYCENYQETMAYELVPFGTIDSEEKFNAALVDLRNQFDGFMAALDDVVAPGGPVETALYEIDARYWYNTVKDREIERLNGILDRYNFDAWDTTATNDIYDIATAYFNKVVAGVRNYVLDTTSETPYTDAVNYFINLYATEASVAEVLVPMETYFDTRYSVFNGPAVPSTAPAVDTYVSYKSVKLDDLGTLEALLITEFSPVDATDEYEYAHYKTEFLTTFANESAKIERITVVGDDYAGALDALDAQYDASARELQKDVYEMKIDRKMVTTEQAVNSILVNNYRNGVGADLFAEYYPMLVQIVNDFNSNIIPSRTLENSYDPADVNKENDATAFANAIAAIEKDLDDAMRKLADTCFGAKLVDKMEELADDVDTYHAAAIAGVEDTYDFFQVIKSQIDVIVTGDAILDDSSITTTTTAYIDEYSALYNAKVAELEAAVADYETLITAAVAATEAVNDAKTDAIDASQALYDAAVEDLGDYDYKVILSNNLNALKRNVGDVEMVRPFHMETVPDTDPVERVEVYDPIDATNLAAARDTALAAIEALKTAYADSLADYVVEMEAYKAKCIELEGRKASIIQRIESYLGAYDGVGGGRLVDDNADIYWSEYTNVFEKNSAIYNGLLNAIEAVKNVKLVMAKTEEQIHAEAVAAGVADSAIDPYFTADEAFANATARATYVRDTSGNWAVKVENGVALVGGTIWKALSDNIVDEINAEGKTSVGTTNFMWTLNRFL